MIYLLSLLLTVFSVSSDANSSTNTAESGETTITLVKPVHADAAIVHGFGPRQHPVTKEERQHTGIDFEVKTGDQVFAAGSGTVVFADYKSGYGNVVEIKHESGFVTRYAHLSEFQDGIVEGMEVEAGQNIALVGQSGTVSGPTLHFELLLDGEAVDPMLYME
ncbi:MAG: M23 family metallopeptidase [Balneolia bacterium]|nr:M23 family metallopeptidase [Balneolia bacterium]